MVGTTIKHYRVDEVLGKGGMGIVYLARDTRLDRPVALKMLPEHLMSDPDRRKRFLREARAACAVNHPAIAQVYDVDETEEGIFIVMELVEGRTVRDLVAAKELDLPGAVEIGMQVARGLAKAHEAGIIHRDIKADNIMVTRDGHAKILDFGLAKLQETRTPGTDSGDPRAASLADTRTKVGIVLGTVGSMSPEQARGQPLDHRSDIFSLGIVLYEMVTGEAPFSGDSPIETLHAIAYQETRPVTMIRASVPASLDRVVSRCLRKKPEERYESAHALAHDLKRVQREIESGISASIPLRERIRDGWRSLKDRTPGEWALPVGGVIVVLGLLYLVVSRKGEVGPGAVALGLLGLVIYRRFRNRGRRLVKRFASKVKKLPEVQVIAVDGQRATVVVERALAKTYVRINALMDGVNRWMYFGEPYSVVIRDDLARDEVLSVLRGPGVVYVRPDVTGGVGSRAADR